MLDSKFTIPKQDDKEWELSLPYDSDWRSSRRRVRLAYSVFMGHNDVLTWEGGDVDRHGQWIEAPSQVNRSKVT